MALELALANFANRAGSQERTPFSLGDRLDASGIKALLEKVGLRGAFAVVLPLIVDETSLSTDTLRGCREAIEVRNNVVHAGQRDVDEERFVCLPSRS